jgi:hypothetical protein
MMISYVSHSIELPPDGGIAVINGKGKPSSDIVVTAKIWLKVNDKIKEATAFSVADRLKADWLLGAQFDALRKAFCQALNLAVELIGVEAKDGKVVVSIVIGKEKSTGLAVTPNAALAFLLALIRAVNLSGVSIED